MNCSSKSQIHVYSRLLGAALLLSFAHAPQMAFAAGMLGKPGAALAEGQDTVIILALSPANNPVNGFNVNTVQYPGGAFTQNQNGGWTESNNNGTYSFVETGRDEWSVYLNDPSRNVQIQLDLHRNKILYGEDGGPKRDQYNIIGAQGTQVSVGPRVTQESFDYTCNTGNQMNVIFETGGPVAYAYFTYGGSQRVTLKQVPSNFGSQFTDGNYHMMVDGAEIRLKQSNNNGSDTCYVR